MENRNYKYRHEELISGIWIGICIGLLISVLIFGIFSLILIYVVVPICFYLAKKINKTVFLIICISF